MSTETGWSRIFWYPAVVLIIFVVLSIDHCCILDDFQTDVEGLLAGLRIILLILLTASTVRLKKSDNEEASENLAESSETTLREDFSPERELDNEEASENLAESSETTLCENFSPESELEAQDVEQTEKESVSTVLNAVLNQVDNFAQRYGILDDKSRMKMLKLCDKKARKQGNTHFDQDLKEAYAEFVGEKIDNEFTTFKDLRQKVVKCVPEDKWMRFVRLHLNLEEEEIQKFKRRFATFTKEQANNIKKKIRGGNMHALMIKEKLLIGASMAGRETY